MPPDEVPAVSTLALPKENPKTRTPDFSVGPPGRTNCGSRLVSTKELSKMWDMPESTLQLLALRRNWSYLRETRWPDKV
jgi:hypothetical protein